MGTTPTLSNIERIIASALKQPSVTSRVTVDDITRIVDACVVTSRDVIRRPIKNAPEEATPVRRGVEPVCESGPNFVTVLRAQSKNKRLTKSFSRVGGKTNVRSYDDVKNFDEVETREITSLKALRDLLLELASDPRRCIIRGEPSEHAAASLDADGYLRRTSKRQDDGSEPSFVDVPRSWVMLDIDGGDNCPHDMTAPGGAEKVARWSMSRLGRKVPCFSGVSFVWQASASAGVKPGPRLHVWCRLFSPLTSRELRYLLRDSGVDAAPLTAVGIHYTADPIFSGVDARDPMAGIPRVGYVRTEQPRVYPPVLDLPSQDLSRQADTGEALEARPDVDSPRTKVLRDHEALCALISDIAAKCLAGEGHRTANSIGAKVSIQRARLAWNKRRDPDEALDATLDRYLPLIDEAMKLRTSATGSYERPIMSGIIWGFRSEWKRLLQQKKTVVRSSYPTALLGVAKDIPKDDDVALAAKLVECNSDVSAAQIRYLPEIQSFAVQMAHDSSRWITADSCVEGYRAMLDQLLETSSPTYVPTRGPKQGQELKSMHHRFLVDSSTIRSANTIAAHAKQRFAIDDRTHSKYVLSFAAQASTFDTVTNTMTHAACPMRPDLPREGRRIPWIENKILPKWYGRKGFTVDGSPATQRELLLDYLHVFTRLDRSVPLLFLWGDERMGKSAFVSGLSRLWGTSGASKAEQAMGQFSATIARCPLVFADEKLPEGRNGDPDTAKLRMMIENRTHKYEQKFQRATEIHGCLRFVAAANKRDIFAFESDGAATQQDVSAIASRILELHIDEENGCERLTPEEGQRLANTDELALHVLWLSHEANYKGTSGERMACRANGLRLVKSATQKSPLQSIVAGAVCDVIVSSEPDAWILYEDRTRKQLTLNGVAIDCKTGQVSVSIGVLLHEVLAPKKLLKNPANHVVAKALAPYWLRAKGDTRFNMSGERYRPLETSDLVRFDEEEQNGTLAKRIKSILKSALAA